VAPHTPPPPSTPSPTQPRWRQLPRPATSPRPSFSPRTHRETRACERPTTSRHTRRTLLNGAGMKRERTRAMAGKSASTAPVTSRGGRMWVWWRCPRRRPTASTCSAGRGVAVRAGPRCAGFLVVVAFIFFSRKVRVQSPPRRGAHGGRPRAGLAVGWQHPRHRGRQGPVPLPRPRSRARPAGPGEAEAGAWGRRASPPPPTRP